MAFPSNKYQLLLYIADTHAAQAARMSRGVHILLSKSSAMPQRSWEKRRHAANAALMAATTRYWKCVKPRSLDFFLEMKRVFLGNWKWMDMLYARLWVMRYRLLLPSAATKFLRVSRMLPIMQFSPTLGAKLSDTNGVRLSRFFMFPVKSAGPPKAKLHAVWQALSIRA